MFFFYLTSLVKEDKTPLHVACLMNNVDLVAFLLDHGADPNITYHVIRTCCVNLVQIVRVILVCRLDAVI